MLRVYEQKGLLEPHRTQGGTRRYNSQELDRIGEITTLLAAGLNLAGVEHVLRLRAENHRLQREVDRLGREHTPPRPPRQADHTPVGDRMGELAIVLRNPPGDDGSTGLGIAGPLTHA